MTSPINIIWKINQVNNNTSSEYISQCRRNYSLYVIRSRAIPAITDGLKSATRRVIWTARDGNKYKSATLAGATMPIHPHSSPEDAINTVTAPYGNNIPLFTGYGAFGTLLGPKDYGASRYTSVKISKFTKDVLLRDIEIIPMMENYDSTLEEPQHFLPLIPVALLNPTEGIAVGFAANILPRSLDDVIISQICYLTGNTEISNPIPKFTPLQNASHKSEVTERGIAFYFDGEFERLNSTTVKITKIPYGLSHTKVIAKLDSELEKGTIIDYDDGSRDVISIVVKFKKGTLNGLSDEAILKMFGLSIRHIENLNVLDFSGQSVWSTDPVTMIKKFCDWRLTWYVKRYERLRDLLLIEIQRYLDIQTAIKNNMGGVAKKTKSRSELKDFLEEIGVVYTDYIADLPIYRFTEEEKQKNEAKLQEANKQLQEYNELLQSETKRKNIYITELKEILTNFTKGKYNNEQEK